MPSLGADMEVGTVTQWLIAPGAEVHRGDIVAVVDTEKATLEVEVFENGIVEELLVDEGREVPVGTPLARIRAAEAKSVLPALRRPAELPTTPQPLPPPTPTPGPLDTGIGAVAPLPAPAIGHPASSHESLSPVVRRLADRLDVDLTRLAGSAPGGRITRADVERAAARSRPLPRASPYARKLAAQREIDLLTLRGTGPGGAVVAADVDRAGAAPGNGPTRRTTEDRRTTIGAGSTAGARDAETGAVGARPDRRESLRRATAALMARSKREIPHYYLSSDVDVSRATRWLEATNLALPVTARLIMPVLMLKAVARAVLEVPEMNGYMVGDEFVPGPGAHIGVAVSLRGGGVVAPAVHDVDQLSLSDLRTAMVDLVQRARRGALRASEVSDATITVTNLGDLGVDSVFGVIYPPQVALVGFGRVSERPWAEGGLLGVRPCVTLTLCGDHRANDGHRGARFLTAIQHQLEHPEEL